MKNKSEEPVKSPSAKQEETVPNKVGVITPAGKPQVFLKVSTITEYFMTFPPDVKQLRLPQLPHCLFFNQ